MTKDEMNEIVAKLANAFQTRDYASFLSYFTEEAVFEIPFGPGGGKSISGLPKIREHFENMRQSPWAKQIQTISITPQTYPDVEKQTITVEFFMEGKTTKTDESFKIQSSLAIIQFKGKHITHYKDFPNTLGLAKNAGLLKELAGQWTKD